MTATGATYARLEIEQLKASLASASACPPTSVASLQGLLGASSKSPPLAEDKEKIEPKESDLNNKRAKPSQARVKPAKSAEKSSNTRTTAPLSPYDKFVLATEVVNLSLKSLSEGQISTPKVTDQTIPTAGLSCQKRDASKIPLGSGRTSKTVGPRVGAQRSTALSRTSHELETIQNVDANHASDSGLVAIAECARLAFAYMRTLEAWKTSGKDMPPLQVENGMLSLIGKMVANGMENLAVKELRVLKGRLEGHMRSPDQRGLEKSETAQEKRQETLASLLQLENVDLQSPVLPLAIQHQLYVLKIIASSRKAATIESASKHLQLSSPSSPVNLLSSLSERPGYKTKAARQLEIMSKIMLSLCPSILASEDKAACTGGHNSSPETVFRLQSLAFEVRIKWWNLSNHRGNYAKDLFDPFCKCLKAFDRRSSLHQNETYSLAVEMFRRIEVGVETVTKTEAFEDNFSCRRVLSTLAQSAGFAKEAVDWMRAKELPHYASGTPVTHLIAQVRIASVSLEHGSSGNGTNDLHENVEAVLGALRKNAKLDTRAQQLLLTEFSGLRKSAALVCNESDDDQTLQQSCFSLVAANAQLLADYVCSFVGRDSLQKEIDSLSKDIKGTMESVTSCCRTLISNRSMTWDALDQILGNCASAISCVERAFQDDCQELQRFRSYTQHPFVRLSGLYWLFSAQLQKSVGLVEKIVRPMQKAVELLQHRPVEEKTTGILLLKCQKLGEVLESLSRLEDAEKTFTDSFEIQLQWGVLQDAAGKASSKSLQVLMGDDQFAQFLRTLKTLHHLSLRNSHRDDSPPNIIDRKELDIPSRALLLELQLAVCCHSHLKGRYPGALLTTAISSLSKLLFELYDETAYPLRRQRVAACVLRLGLDGQDVLDSSLRYDALQSIVSISDSLESDNLLIKYREHYAASHKVAVALLETPPSLEKLQHAMRTWQDILDKSDSWKRLLENVDDFDSWISQLSVLADFFGMKGMQRLRIIALSIINKALKLPESLDLDFLLRNSADLAQQYLDFGYSGRAGLVLAGVRHAVEATVSTNAAVQWHVAYAQHMLALGNGEGCIEALGIAQKLAAKDIGPLASAGSIASFSTRIKHTQLISTVALTQSRLSLAAGHPSEALSHAKQCVNLNKKIWMAVENRAISKTIVSGNENYVEDVVESVKKLSVQGNYPTVISMTHAALTGAQCWPFVPSIFRGLLQLSNVFAHQGLLQEAIYYAEQATKVAEAVDASSLVVASLGLTSRFYLDSNRIEDAMETLAKAANHSKQAMPNADLALYHCVAARAYEISDNYETAATEFDAALNIISSLIQPDYIRNIEKNESDDRKIVDLMLHLDVGEPGRRGRRVAATRTSTKKSTKAGAAKTPNPKKTATNLLYGVSSNAGDECQHLQGLQAVVLCHKANLLLSKDKLFDAVELISQAEQLSKGLEASVQHQSTRFRSLMSEAMKEIAADFTFNALPESTISFPALSWNERKFSESFQQKPASAATIASASSSISRRGARGKKGSKGDFNAILHKARDCISEVHTKALGTSSTSAVYRVCKMLNEVTILLSATSYRGSKGTLHPLFAAYLTELPKTNAFELEKKAVSIESRQMSRAELLSWPSQCEDTQKPSRLTTAEFQSDYIDIIPTSWTTLSLSLNEAHDELYITRYIAHQSPFILRLPLSRHQARDVDEELFGFEEAKAELKEIIDLSDFSVRNTQNLTAKGAKTEWWAQREALDCRLHDLLVNMENIWLGGFRGIFSVKKGDKPLLGRFQKSFQNILDRHLPSRQGKGKQAKKTQLDSRILELFVGLGSPDDDRDLDDSLMDLVYFVVDILQFNGEKNAYDEIDFDAIIIEMLDALRAFHQAADPTPTSRHTILILDKNLHGFPWESLPSLQPLSISRLPSMSALRERLFAVQEAAGNQPNVQTQATDETGYHLDRSSLNGTTFLNPGGDLKHTQATLSPFVQGLPGSWLNLIGRTPNEKLFESSIAEKDLLLFFGHGSGAQYIRGRTVRKLQIYKQTGEKIAAKKPLAISLLFGCSSAHVTENGEFEPSGMLYNYVTAGVPAIMGMLWDVTDKDCDRFAVATLSSWGLFAAKEASDGDETAKPRAKSTSSKRDKSKSRAEKETQRRALDTGTGTMGLDEAVARSRDACYLRYLNGAAAVVYGIPVFLDS